MLGDTMGGTKKGEMSLSRIIVAIIVLTVLIVSIAIFVKFMRNSDKGITNLTQCKNQFGGECKDEGSCDTTRNRILRIGCGEGEICCVEK